jgi:hypothetical protein
LISCFRGCATPTPPKAYFRKALSHASHPQPRVINTDQQGAAYIGTEGNIAAIEFMTSFRAISLAKN